MLNYLDFLDTPYEVATLIISILIIMQFIGEIIEFKGKTVPEFMKIRKYFARKKQERETLAKMPDMMKNMQSLLNDVNQHYSKDNITMRDAWMRQVNESMMEFNNIKEIVLDIQIDNKRNTIIGFVNRAIDMDIPISKEEYERIFALHAEYDKIIKDNNLTNGQVVISYDLIKESYEERMKSHNFIEYGNGYKTK